MSNSTALRMLYGWSTAEPSQPSTDPSNASLGQPGAAPAATVDRLRAAGHRLVRVGDRLIITDHTRLTPDDCRWLHANRTALLELAEPMEMPTEYFELIPPLPAPLAETTTSANKSLAQFLGASAPELPADWRPDEPPDLDGIDNIILNFATTGLDWRTDKVIGVTVSTLDQQLVRFLPFAFQGGGNLDSEAVKRWVERTVRGKHIINSNTKFELHMSRSWNVDLEAQGCTFSDIQHTAALLDDARRKFAIDLLAADFLPNEQIVARRDESRHGIYSAYEAADREKYTATLVAKLRDVMYPELNKQELLKVQQLENRVIPVTVEMERNAAPVNRELLKQWSQETDTRAKELLWDIAKEVGFEFNPDSSDHWAKLFKHFNIPIATYTAKSQEAADIASKAWSAEQANKFRQNIAITESEFDPTPFLTPSFTDKVLAAIDNKFVQMGRKAGKLLSLRAKFLVPWDERVGDDRLLRYNLHQLRGDEKGTVRGRYSSSDVNIQQVMNHDTHISSFETEDYFIRRLIEPDRVVNPKAKWISADAMQIEFRLFGHYSVNRSLNRAGDVVYTPSKRLVQAYADDPLVSFHRVAEKMIKPYRQDLPYTKVKSMNFLCTTLDTPILMDDLKWTPAGAINVGDKLLAFDETQQEGVTGRAGARRWRASTVVGYTTQISECYEITLENGDILECTGDHRWIVKGWQDKNRWRRTDQLTTETASSLLKVVDVWHEDMSKDAGWLAGFFDGEGHASISGSQLSVHQNAGDLLNHCIHILNAKKYGISLPENPRSTSSTQQITMTGVVSDRLRFLGEIRPQRLIGNFVKHINGRMLQAKEHVRVVGMRLLGLREVAVIETDTRTYIANGYASHNCVYGGGKAHLGEYLDIPQSLADEFYQVYHQAFPEVRSTSKMAQEIAETMGYVRSILGRRARFPDKKFAYKALNAVIQPSAADIFKQKCVEVYEERKRIGFTMRMPVHDELAGDAADEQTRPLLAEILNRQSFELRVPILWSVNTGDNWAECK